jgi:hypothetical protein
MDAFLARLDAAGSGLTYSTFLGGSSNDTGHGISVDADGAGHATGTTGSSNFPTTPGAFQTTHGGDLYDAFVVKLAMGATRKLYLPLVLRNH